MKHNKTHLFITIFSAILFALFLPTSLMAQSESYLDTIYRAVNGNNTYSPDYETDTEVEVMAETSNASDESDKVFIDADVPSSSNNGVDSGKSSPVSADGKIDVNIVLSDMTRILIGMNTGLQINTSSFTIIDMGNGVLNTDTQLQQLPLQLQLQPQILLLEPLLIPLRIPIQEQQLLLLLILVPILEQVLLLMSQV